MITHPKQRIKSDQESFLAFFSKNEFDKLKLENKIVQDIVIQKISYFKGYSIEKVDKLLNADIGRNNSFDFFELNRNGFVDDYGNLTNEGYSCINKHSKLKKWWFFWVVIGSILIVLIQFCNSYRNFFLIIGVILLPFFEIRLLHLGNQINQIKRFNLNRANSEEYRIEIDGKIFLARVSCNRT